MTALPPQIDVAEKGYLKDYPNGLSAYNVCLKLQERAVSKNSNSSILAARVLGYLILHPASATAIHRVVNDIHSCDRDLGALSELGDKYINQFIRLFKKFKGRTPQSSSSHTSPPLIKGLPRNRVDAKEQALIRDGYRCVISGRYDVNAKNVSSDEKRQTGGVVHTECAHIVPESTYFNVSTTGTSGGSLEKTNYASSALAVLERFGYPIETLNGPKVHSLHNVMTLQKDVHDFFDRLELCLEETRDENCYRVKTFVPDLFLPEKITLTTPDPDEYPLPDPRLLALHASCAKVAHLSGAGEYIDEIDRDVEKLGVLAHDGGSSDVLTHAILRSVASIDVRG